MKRLFQTMLSGIANWFSSSSKKKLSRSQLVGMYLSESNGNTRDLAKTRQRRDGSYTQARK